MKINTNGITNSPLAPKPSAPPVQAAPQFPTEGLPQDSSAYMPSLEWLHLLGQMKQEPDIRDDRVAVAVERLRQGYYATPESAAKTAEAKLNTAD